MKNLLNFNHLFGSFLVFILLSILILLVFLRRFGFASEFGSFLLFLSIIVVFLQLIEFKTSGFDKPKKVLFNKFVLLAWVGVIVLVIVVYRSLFLPGPVVWGDAPYIYQKTFSDFLSEPLVWGSKGDFGSLNKLFWIYPLMVIYHGLGTYLNLNNDVVIRLIFYFPAIFFAVYSPWRFSQYFGFSKVVSLFTVIVYALSTYFILVIDGGQVGVALAYGLFPFVLLQLHKLWGRADIFQFMLSLISFMVLIFADVRFGLMAILAFGFWICLERIRSIKKVGARRISVYLILMLSALGMSSYFLIPNLLLSSVTAFGAISDLKLITILNPLFLFSPHWPLNEFGKVFPPQWFFAGIPLLIFSNLLFKKTRSIYFIMFNFLFFVFLAKGDTGFMGGIYAFTVSYIPLGESFRDSTKFFAPVNLFAGILIGLSIESLARILKSNSREIIYIIAIFYFILLLKPAIFGEMNGVLRARDFPNDINIVASKLQSENGFFRTVWFPDRHPLGFSSFDQPAIDAKLLVNLRPISSLNVGDYDRFNFLNNGQFLEWMDILGIRYLIFSGDKRVVTSSPEKKKDWDQLLQLVDKGDELQKLEWGTDFPIYQTRKNKPHIFTVDKIFAVVGGDDIYQKLLDLDVQNSLGNQGFVFFEDGKFDPKRLEQVASGSAIIVFNQKQEKDLILSDLASYFRSTGEALNSEWAIRKTEEYLRWKFELLVNKVDTHEFDYGKGIAFSSVANEKLRFKFKVSNEGEYVLAIRAMVASESGSLRASFAGQTGEILSPTSGRFEWYTEEVKLDNVSYDLVLENTKGFQVVNVVALIPKIDWENSRKITQNLLSKFKVVHNISELVGVSHWQEINYKMISSVEYSIDNFPTGSWLVFSDTYHPSWELWENNTRVKSDPFYSAINGFYISQNGSGRLYFKDQKIARIGAAFSLVSLGVIIVVLGWIYRNRRKR